MRLMPVACLVSLSTVVLGGGCFQNAFLWEESLAALAARGRTVLKPARFPANDGGLAADQALAAARLHPPP